MISINKMQSLKSDEDRASTVASALENLKRIYSNKSSDEYKSSGDITKSPIYESIEGMIGYLSDIKGFPPQSIKELKTMFNVLHRPIWKRMVTEFMHESNDKNTIYTLLYTTGYRVLVGELGRIFASTNATEKGIIYKPDKVSRKKDMYPFIRRYNDQLEQNLDKYIKEVYKVDFHQEAANVILATIDEVLGAATGIIIRTFAVLDAIFVSAKEMNPISLANALLSRHYDKKIQKFNAAVAMYKATKEAYDDYMKLPPNKRKERIEHKYVKNIEKYNIKMQDLKAEIDHYDKRAHEEAGDEAITIKDRWKQKAEARKKKRAEKKTAPKNDPKTNKKDSDKTNTTNDDKTQKEKDSETQANPSGEKDDKSSGGDGDFNWDF